MPPWGTPVSGWVRPPRPARGGMGSPRGGHPVARRERHPGAALGADAHPVDPAVRLAGRRRLDHHFHRGDDRTRQRRQRDAAEVPLIRDVDIGARCGGGRRAVELRRLEVEQTAAVAGDDVEGDPRRAVSVIDTSRAIVECRVHRPGEHLAVCDRAPDQSGGADGREVGGSQRHTRRIGAGRNGVPQAPQREQPGRSRRGRGRRGPWVHLDQGFGHADESSDAARSAFSASSMSRLRKCGSRVVAA